MRRLLLLLLLNTCCAIGYAQQWQGSSSETETIYRSGNVGIGTTDVSAQLHVGNGTGNKEIKLDGNQSKLRLLSYGTQGNLWIQSGQNWTSGSTANLLFSGINGLPVHMIIQGNGNVGIGTTSPTKKLDVRGSMVLDAGKDPGLFTGTGTTELNRFLLLLNSPSQTSASGLKAGGILVADTYAYANPGKNDLVVKGRVSIGTTSTGSHKLAVEGTIGAREVKVESSGWSDFVFKEDYSLKQLEEVESFIRQNQRLPDIPSEKEVLENGIELGKMDAKLLQKIEELTLYIIQQQKEIENLKAAFDQYKKYKENE